jgi:hypothetical protein
VFVGTQPGQESFTPVQTLFNAEFNGKASTTVARLEPGQKYYFTVAAFLDDGEVTLFSNEANATPRKGWWW